MAERPTVVAIGDSLTLGVGDGTQHPTGDVGWAAHTAYALGAAAFANLAENGTRARDLTRSQVAAAVAVHPDVVLASAGGNDVLRGDFDAAEVEQALRGALATLAAPRRRILVLTIDRIGLFDLLPSPVTAVMARRIAAANGAIVAAAHAAGATLVHGGAVFSDAGPRAWHIDRIHPSPLGHRRLAAAAVHELRADWPLVHPVPDPPRPPRVHARAWWLVRNGAPWAVKRSRDLIPQVARVVTHELLEERRAQRPVRA
ncbi:GDSL-type esterase/lipase family protein [uncultured Demequina sp.]|mgnify:CR=1 FL=1|uniref:GDSL-type esterase/lipase family protein n=1 Tax=uncultured Demequina sp. TaxID=693499 RepID=UPI0025D47477|nr:GDSL-type esterase/lipase family protein [uncultured Demequina sp.]